MRGPKVILIQLSHGHQGTRPCSTDHREVAEPMCLCLKTTCTHVKPPSSRLPPTTTAVRTASSGPMAALGPLEQSSQVAWQGWRLRGGTAHTQAFRPRLGPRRLACQLPRASRRSGLHVARSSVAALHYDETARDFRHVRCDVAVRSAHRRNIKSINYYKHAQNPSTDILTLQ